jgi:murein DD-endopeptidase MepM/ murein hydrolase activator NlpD
VFLDRLIDQNPQDLEVRVTGTPPQAKKSLFSKLFLLKLVLTSQFILSIGLFPVLAQASILSIFGLGETASAQSIPTSAVLNSQTVALLQATLPMDKADDEDGLSVVADNALSAQTGPLGTQADSSIDEVVPDSTEIYTYVVRNGDNLPAISKMLGVSVGTIVWANDLSGKNAKLVPGQVLAILPVSGISYTVKKGDTVSGIAKQFKVDADEIGKFNGLELDSKLAAGDKIIVPGAELSLPAASTKSSGTKSNSKLPIVAYGATRLLPGNDGPDLGGYFRRPVDGCTRTQGAHGKNGVDIGCPVGTPIYAAASGTVLIAKTTGWNGGFGMYVVINHPNGTQTLYGHMSKVIVSPGQAVSKGEQIGLMGSTGRSTGSHVHFEVHGAINPIAVNARYGL